jgi:hypothetical protein
MRPTCRPDAEPPVSASPAVWRSVWSHGARRPRNRAGPLLYLVDDAHRLDHSSADELVFAARGPRY